MKHKIKNNIEFMEVVKHIASSLSDGLETKALNDLIREMAWSSPLEMLGEVGQALKRVKSTLDDSIPSDLYDEINVAMDYVGKCWPKIGK